MRALRSTQRGFSLVMAMIVIVVVTALVAGAIAFTGAERSAAMLYTRQANMSACVFAARNLFLSKVRVFQFNAGSIDLNAGIPTEDFDGDGKPDTMEIRGGHYSAAPPEVRSIKVTRISGARFGTGRELVEDMSNLVGVKRRTGDYFQINAVCRERADGGNNVPETEVEFIVRSGL